LRVLNEGGRKLIAATIQAQLGAFWGGVDRKKGFQALLVGGTGDHARILLSPPAAIPLAKAVQLLKGASQNG